METTLPLPFLVSVNVPPGLGGEKEGLNREEVSCLGCVFFEVTPQTLDKVLSFLGRHNTEFQPFFDVTSLESRDDIISILDAGARKVFVRPEQ
jgi:phosphoribosyl-ATP pyrophosphohydrolase/phosphoribosyl-AMP cyclohydrolase/histidinol dehydrogenase